jgi:drug/metabolite transporter (DMT)-like permease
MVAKGAPKQKKRKMAGPLRAGIALIILGAVLVGLGSLLNRESISTYGFVVVVGGFFLYFVSYYYLDRVQKRKTKSQR